MKIKVAYFITMSPITNPENTPVLHIETGNVFMQEREDWLEETLKRNSVVDAGWIEVELQDVIGFSVARHEESKEAYRDAIRFTEESIQSLLCLPHLENADA